MPVNHPLFGNAVFGYAPLPATREHRSRYIVDSQRNLRKTLPLLAAVCWVGGAFSLMVLAGLREAHQENSAMTGLINMCICSVMVGISVYRPVSFFNWYEGQHHQPTGVRHGRQ